MYSQRKVLAPIGLLLLCSVFLMGHDSWDDPAGLYPPLLSPADPSGRDQNTLEHPDSDPFSSHDTQQNPFARILPMIHLLLLSEDPPSPVCAVDEDCDDGDVCNGLETCVAGVCLPGTPLVCDDGNPCTLDWCDSVTGCNHVCNADGQADPCCEDPACSSTPICQFPGGVFVSEVTGLTQKPLACFLGPIQHAALMALLDFVEVPVYLPPESAYPTMLTFEIPLLGDLEVMARFEDGEIHFDEVDLDPIHLSDYFAFLPPAFEWLADVMQCVIDAKATGWTLGLDASGFIMTVRLYDLVVTREYPGSSCVLYEKPVNPSCQMNFTVTGTRYVP